jgi:hypothetical protein
MMAQISHGYPDFGRYQAESDVLFNFETVTTISAPTLRTFNYVGNYRYIGIQFGSNLNGFLVRVEFYADALFATPTGAFAFAVRDGGDFSGSFQVTGPFCRVRITPAAANSVFSMTAWSSVSEFVNAGGDSNDNLLVSYLAAPVNAGATRTDLIDRTYPGEAYWACDSNATTWEASIFVEDYVGTLSFIQRVDQRFPRHSERVILPAGPVRVTMFNNSGANALASMSLVARPWYAGR